MRLVVHRGRVAALAAERVYYASHIEVLEPDHPERRFVAALCLYSHAVDTGRARRSDYDQGDAERFARALRFSSISAAGGRSNRFVNSAPLSSSGSLTLRSCASSDASAC